MQLVSESLVKCDNIKYHYMSSFEIKDFWNKIISLQVANFVNDVWINFRNLLASEFSDEPSLEISPELNTIILSEIKEFLCR